jgi:hypothetical protein
VKSDHGQEILAHPLDAQPPTPKGIIVNSANAARESPRDFMVNKLVEIDFDCACTVEQSRLKKERAPSSAAAALTSRSV